MAVHLPDVNVLIALHDPEHQHHAVAQTWFQSLDEQGWATCPLTENGFVRIFSSAKYPNHLSSVSQALYLLRNTTGIKDVQHNFWPDVVSLHDTALFLPGAIVGHRQITDVYLLGLCQHRGGTLVTLDDNLSTDAIVAPHSQLLRKL